VSDELHVGFAGYVPLKLCDDRRRAKRLARLLADERWPWELTWARFSRLGVYGRHIRPRRVDGADGSQILAAGIVSPANRKFDLDHDQSVYDNHASFHLDTGQLVLEESAAPFDVQGKTRGHGLAEEDMQAWIELVHEILSTVGVVHAVLTVWPTWMMLDSDLSFTSFVLDTPRAQYAMGVVGPFERHVKRANYWRPQLGRDYVRHPRWGNYLRREHLDRVGGLDKIRDTVPLAKIVELGDGLVYLQCTEHPATALAPEGARIRQLLEDALAPILVPAIPGEEAHVQLPPLPAKRR
jgi:hypothetical protein